MNKNFFVEDNKYYAMNASAVVHKLPSAVYQLNFDTRSNNYYYEKIENFTLPEKLYGSINKIADRIWNTFNMMDKSIGALLVGNQGSGKTLLTKFLSDIGLRNNIPTIIISSPFKGENFIASLLNIEDEAIIIFDEFEKVYDRDEKEQSQLLTILDGVINTKKLFLFTANKEYKILSTFFNRPGRIRYLLRYYKLSNDVIEEYCKDNLLNFKYKNQILKLPTVIQDFSYDMLVELVRELNFYNESLEEVLDILNIKPDRSYNESLEYTVTYMKNNEIIDYCWPVIYKGNPLSSNINSKMWVDVQYTYNTNDKNEIDYDNDDTEVYQIKPASLSNKISSSTSSYSRKNFRVEISIDLLKTIESDGTMSFDIGDDIVAILKPKYSNNTIFDIKKFLV